MITCGTRVVRNTIWSYQPALAAPSREDVYVTPARPTRYSVLSREDEDRQLRAELSARLAKFCHYSGKTARR